MNKRDPDVSTGVVTLSPEEQEAISGAKSWVDSSAVELGLAYLEFEEARQRFDLAEKNLASRASSTRQAEFQRNQVMAQFVELLSLPPGQWVYDGANKLVKKDAKNAKSS
ncbi:MAG: hypothetical protein JRC99_10930 [Deltaproteobacteria bacterium]|nr:hypothetical protein [Deltaproteobacteria bacterium]